MKLYLNKASGYNTRKHKRRWAVDVKMQFGIGELLQYKPLLARRGGRGGGTLYPFAIVMHKHEFERNTELLTVFGEMNNITKKRCFFSSFFIIKMVSVTPYSRQQNNPMLKMLLTTVLWTV